MLAAQDNLPAESQPAHFYVDQTGAVAAGGNQHMGLREIGVEIEGAGDSGMPGAGHHHERLSQQPFLMNGFTGRHRDVDSEIEGSACEFRFQISALDAGCGNRHLWRFAFQTLEEGGKNQGSGIFPERDVEIAPCMGGIELMTLLEVYLQYLQGLPYLVDHVAGKGSGNHVRAAANEQRIFQEIAQALQGVADGGLGEVQLVAGPGDVSLAVNGFQYDEEVEIDLAQMHETYITGFVRFI